MGNGVAIGSWQLAIGDGNSNGHGNGNDKTQTVHQLQPPTARR
jgi:hypothetical protein